MVVQHCSQQVVGRADRVEITREMKVDVFHGNNLRVTASGSTALNTEYRSEGRLTKGENRILSDLAKAIAQSDRRCGLTLAGRCRCNGCYKNQFSVRLILFILKNTVIYFCLVVSVKFKIFVVYTGTLCDLGNRLHDIFLCNLDIRFNLHNVNPPHTLL